MYFSKSRRLLPLIVACAGIGAGAALYAEAAPAGQVASAAPSPAPRVRVTSDEELNRLRAILDAADKAAKAEDWDTASDETDKAEELVGNWPPELVKKAEDSGLLKRLRDLENQYEEVAATQPEDGLKMAEESVTLTGEDLRKQLDQVTAAEHDAVFDFPIDLNDKVLSWVYDFTHAKRGFVEGALSRATQFLPMVRQVFQEEGVPQDLAYLALIESGFKNTARSTANAVGMWQFIRSTGRLFGLDGNAWVEERRDPVKSCRASARYLRRLYESSGDWYLALAGYNAGPLTLDRASAALGTYNFWDLARSGYLRNETKDYVPKLLAAILVGRFPERYGLNIVQMPPYAYEIVDVDRMTSLSVLARFAGTDVDALKDLNPQLLRATTPPGHYQLRVPPGAGGVTSRALARIPAGQRLDFQTYVIRRGDTLAKVAARFKMDPSDLLAANDLTKAQFRAGRRIQVPPASPVPIDERDLKPIPAQERTMMEQPLAQLPAISVEQPAAPAVARPVGPVLTAKTTARASETAAASRPPAVHRVKRGETLFSISERYGIPLADLRKWNKLRRDQIAVGQVLKLKKS